MSRPNPMADLYRNVDFAPVKAPEPKVDIGWLLNVYANASTPELANWVARLKRDGPTRADLEQIDDLQRVIEERARG